MRACLVGDVTHSGTRTTVGWSANDRIAREVLWGEAEACAGPTEGKEQPSLVDASEFKTWLATRGGRKRRKDIKILNPALLVLGVEGPLERRLGGLDVDHRVVGR